MDRSATKGLKWNGSDAADSPENWMCVVTYGAKNDSRSSSSSSSSSSSGVCSGCGRDIPKSSSIGWVRPNYLSSFGCVRPNYPSSIGGVQPSYCTSFSRICVEGYDTSLYEYDLKLALRKHFSSCGEITHIYVPRDFERNILKSFAFIHIAGEGAEEKALALSGSDAGGWNVFAKSSPYDGQYVDPGWATAESPRFSLPQRKMIVAGYDTSLPEIDIQIRLSNHFSSCGEITNVMIPKDANGGLDSTALISILGAGSVEKALELGGCDVGGWNIAVVTVLPPLGTTIRYCSSSSLSSPIKSKMTTRTKKKKSTME